MKHGNFDNLAKNYRKYRPGYNKDLLNKIFIMLNLKKMTVLDIGAGTGIMTNLISKIRAVKKIYAIEPSFSMIREGKKFVRSKKVLWIKGKAENFPLKKRLVDVIVSASSFHWYNHKKCLKQFLKVINPAGFIILAWNPRVTTKSIVENKIQKVLETKYKIKKRYSSGKYIKKKNIINIFKNSSFKFIKYYSQVDKKKISINKYLGAWKSVNDIQVQLGKKKFFEFLHDIKKIIKNISYVDVYYESKFFILKNTK
jgi:ubiquinone/menaquinone biosynthesis C-methylase UbiE